MMDRPQRTLDDLQRGEFATPVDVLRLALHYVLRGGWTPRVNARAGLVRALMGVADQPTTIVEAVFRAQAELRAPWMVGLKACQEIRAAVGASRESAEAIAQFERVEGRTADDVKEAFKRALLSLMSKQKGLVVDVAA